MARRAPVVNIIAADESYHRLVQHALDHIEATASELPNAYSAHLLLDFPMAWAIGRLAEMNSLDRAKTLVVTQGTHDAYLDLLASFHISGVVGTNDLRAIVAGIYAAASSLKTYQWKSGLTYMELRVTRLLLQGLDTSTAAERLRVSQKTINAHVSNILGKLGIESRAQYIAALLGNNHH